MKTRSRKQITITVDYTKVKESPIKKQKKVKAVKKANKATEKPINEFTVTKISKKKSNSSQSSIHSLEKEDYSASSESEVKKSPLRKNIKKQKIIKCTTKKHKGKCGYNPTQMTELKRLRSLYDSLLIKDLKEILRINGQSMTGDKKQVIEKVADGEVLGAIPKCPKCSGGHLKYDYKSDEYMCRGFMDDDTWHYCNFTGTSENISRYPWVKPPSIALSLIHI